MSKELAYPLHSTRLDNGLLVIVNPDHSAPIVAVNLWYHVGSKDEQPGRTGLAHLFEHLMFQGSANVNSGDHLNLIQAHGGSVNATTWFDRTNYFETVPVGALDLALWLEADRLGTLPTALTRQNLDNQRDVVKEEKRQRYDNQPYGDVLEHLTSLTFPANHPYGHTTIGSMEDLDAATLDDALEFFRTWYVPGNAVLTLVGDVTPEQGFAAADKYLGQIPAEKPPIRHETAPLPPMSGVPRHSTLAEVPSSAVYFTWRLPARETPQMDALELALDILGGSDASRLHRALVRDLPLASGAGSSAIGLADGTSFGFAYARALNDTPLAQLEQAMVDEITRLAEEGPTPAEVARASVQYERAWLEQCAEFSSRADTIGALATFHGDPGMINTRLARIQAITADDIKQATRKYLTPGHRAVLEYHRKEDDQ